MSNEPNPLDPATRGPWTRIYHGGILCRAALTKIDGVSTEHAWKDQQSKETSGRVWSFTGTTRSKFKCDYVCTTPDEYAWLQAHWEMLKPVPGSNGGAGVTPKAPTGGTQYAAPADTKPGAVGSPSSPAKADAVDAGTSASTTKSSTPNPGPRPPTIAVDYPSLLRHGVTAVAAGKWEDKGFTETLGYEVEIEYVPQDPPKPAGGGALAPATPVAQGQQFSGGSPVQGSASTGAPAAAQAGGT